MDHDYANRIIRFKAHRLMPMLRGAPLTQGDVEAELRRHLIARSSQWDARRGQFSTFINCILDRYCISLLRHWRAQMRDPRREEASLQEVIRDSDDRMVYRSETTSELGHDPWPEFDLVHDLNAAVDEMPSDLQDAFNRARQGEPLPKPLRLAIKRHLEDKGLGIYLT